MGLRTRIDEVIAETISSGNSKGEMTDAIMEILIGEGYVNDDEETPDFDRDPWERN